MEIRSIEIRNLFAKSLKGDYDGVFHVKSLPCLSVVQPLHGSYEVAFDEQDSFIVEEGGAFVSPSGVSQKILHRNGEEGYMEARWVFMKVIVNELYSFEEVFELPPMISSEYQSTLNELLDDVQNAPTLCGRYAAAYRLTDLLISLSFQKPASFDTTVLHLKRYIDEHYSEPLPQEELAEAAACSVPNLYRIFSKEFGLSPRNYINKIRLEKAAILLETGTLPIMEVAQTVGFDDPVYFSRLFKARYNVSPKNYRAEK